jgi:hypothetical protein
MVHNTLTNKPNDPDTQQKSTASFPVKRWIRAKVAALFPAVSVWFSTRRKNRVKGRKRMDAAECEEVQHGAMLHYFEIECEVVKHPSSSSQHPFIP